MNLTAPSKIKMLSPSSAASSVRERLAAGLNIAACAAFAALLFVSPLAQNWTLVARPVGRIYGGYTNILFFVPDLFLLLTLAFWLLSLLAQPHPLKRGPWFLTFPIIGLVALSWLGVLTGIDPVLTAYHSLRFTLFLALYFFLVNESLAPVWVVAPLALGIIGQGIVGLAQFANQHSLGLGAWGELVLDPKDPNSSVLIVNGIPILRAYGLTEHPNILGGFLAFALALLLGYYLWTAQSALWRYLLLIPIALGSIALLFTFSYASTIAFLASIALLVLVLLAKPQDRALHLREIGLAAVIIIGALVLSAQVAQSYLKQNIPFESNPDGEQGLAERDALTLSADRLFYQHELVGVGNGALTEAMYQLDKDFPQQFYYQPAHFVLLDVAAELGILGGMCWLWLLIIPWLALVIKRREVVQAPWLAACAAALLVITIIGFFDYYPWLLEPGRVWQWIAWGLLGSVYIFTISKAQADETHTPA